MCNNFPAWSSVAPAPVQSGSQDYDKYTLAQTHMLGMHGSRHVLLIPLRKQPQTGSVMQRGSVGSRCRRTSKAPDGTLICSWRFSIQMLLQQRHHSSTITHLGSPILVLLFFFFSFFFLLTPSFDLILPPSRLLCFARTLIFPQFFFFKLSSSEKYTQSTHA